MSHKLLIHDFADGEAACIFCCRLLPAHATWPGKRVHVCADLKCISDFEAAATRLKQLAPGNVLIGPDAVMCAGPKCGRMVPGGVYKAGSRDRCCSAVCWSRKDGNSTSLYVCSCGCGTKFRGNSSLSRRKGRAYLDFTHRAQHLLALHVAECGLLGQVALDYLRTFVPIHYRNSKCAKATIFPFFKWCRENAISSLAEIRPKTITQYLAWCKQHKVKTPHYRVAALSVFFDWAIAEERYSYGNPVIHRIHAQRRSQSAPRPLSDSELAQMWRMLEAQDDPRLLFAASIAEEAGLRIGEICNLRVADIDVEGLQVFVRLPNKSNRERYSLFGPRTAEFARTILRSRPRDMKQDHILWNAVNGPMACGTLRRQLRMALCKTYQGKSLRDEGFSSWSTHRLRHNMATSMRRGGANTGSIMALGGWRSMDAASHYVEMVTEDTQREYAAAMAKAQNAKKQNESVVSTALTPAQLLDRVGKRKIESHCA